MCCRELDLSSGKLVQSIDSENHRAFDEPSEKLNMSRGYIEEEGAKYDKIAYRAL